MKALLTFATVALAATTFAGPKEGRGPRPPHGMGMEGPGDPVVRMVTNRKVAEKIGLTEEQRTKINEINKSHRDNSEELHKSLRAAMEKQFELLKADKIDEAAVMAEIDKAFDARKEMAKRQTKRIIAIKSILTPEQVKKALAAFDDEPKGWKGDKPRRGPKPEGCDRPCKGPKPEGGDKPAPAED